MTTRSPLERSGARLYVERRDGCLNVASLLCLLTVAKMCIRGDELKEASVAVVSVRPALLVGAYLPHPIVRFSWVVIGVLAGLPFSGGIKGLECSPDSRAVCFFVLLDPSVCFYFEQSRFSTLAGSALQ